MNEAEGRVDVVEIVTRVERAVAERRRRGEYTQEDVERRVAELRRAYGERARIDPRLLRRLLGRSHDWNIAADYLIRTRRRGLLGGALVRAKRILRPVVRLYTDHIVNRQAQLNLYFEYFLEDAVRELVELRVEVLRLRAECEALRRGTSAPAGGSAAP